MSRGRRKNEDIWDVPGGYMGLKKAKLVDQFSEQARNEDKKEGIFTGVSIFVNGWTKPGSDELKRIMMSHGGVYHHYYNNNITAYIIASNLPDVKLRQLKGHELIVKPEWITSCLEAGRLLDYKPFLLFTHQSKSQATINFQPTNQSINQTIHTPNNSKVNLENCDENIESPAKCDNVSEKEPANKITSPFKAKDATDPRFLGEFYQNSRLHHISTMGANSKEYVNQLREKHDGWFPARDRLKHLNNSATNPQRKCVIMHIDMDCFFVSVGLRKRPDLVGKPVAVTHSRGNKPSMGAEEDRKVADRRKDELQRYKEKLDKKSGLDSSVAGTSWKLDNIDGKSSFSEVASCSYQARQKGVRNGMFLGPALKLCPDLKTIPYDFPGYEEVSRILYDTVASYTLDIQAVSCDEMFVNLTPLLASLNMDPLLFISHLRDQIKSETGCICSVGLGENIFLARMATKQAKPDGQHLLEGQAVNLLLQELKVEELPGVGRSLQRKLSSLNILTCGDLQNLSLSQLQSEVGSKTGSQLYNFCRGIDNRKLELQQVRKTVSAEVNYGIRFSGWQDAEQFLNQLAGEVSERLGKLGTRGKSLTLKLMIRAENAPAETAKFLGHGVCDNISRSAQLSTPTSAQSRIYKEVFNLLKQTETNPADIRGIGISVSKLEDKKTAPGHNSILKFIKAPEALNASKSVSFPPPASSTSRLVAPDSTSNSNTEDAVDVIDEDLDPDVLAALPDHIRAEVLADYKSRSKHSSSIQAAIPDSTLDPLPSGSGINLDVEKEKRTEEEPDTEEDSFRQRRTGESVSLSDISFSQIDGDVLDQLPQELRNEINNHFQNNQPIQNEVFEEELQTEDFSSIMKESPKKVLVVGRKRGRPRKGSTSSLEGGRTTRLKSSTVSSWNQRTTFTSLEDIDEDSTSLDGLTEDADDDEPEPGPGPERVLPSFCGESTLEGIRPLIKEWLRSTDSPESDDIFTMARFLTDLVSARNLCLVEVFIKCFQRNISNLKNCGTWWTALAGLVAQVQKKMVECYGSPLFISEQLKKQLTG